MVYLDNAATTKIHPEVIEVMVDAMSNQFGNPSSTHKIGRDAKVLIETSRKKIAALLNASPAEIIFTSSGTETNNLIIRSCVENLGVQRIITSELEHKCVYETTQSMAQKPNVSLEMVKLGKNGVVDYADLEQKLAQNTMPTLVTLMHGNNEIANLLDLKKVSALCKQYGAYFHTDSVQTMGHYTFDLQDLQVDFASCSAHKFHGPKGAGFAFIRKGTGLKAIITGGGQERNTRAGTENVYGIVALAKAFEMANEQVEAHTAHIKSLKKYCKEALLDLYPSVIFNGESGDVENSLYTVLSVSLPFKNDLIAFQMDIKGIALSQGSACSSGAAKASGVISAILSEELMAKTSLLRISFSIYNTKEDIDFLINALKEISLPKAK